MDAGFLGTSCPSAPLGVTGEGFVMFMNTLMAAHCALSSNENYPFDFATRLKDGDEFDFVVVGAGSGGSIVANRLSENPNWKVLLVEAGDYPSIGTEIPKTSFKLAFSSEDWNYGIGPLKHGCLGLNNKICPCPRGKTLGGSGAINGMIYIRGNRKDYDQWAAKGNAGWDYDSLLPYFKKFEDAHGKEDDRMGKGGELKISAYVNNQTIRDIYIEAYKEMGYGEYTDEHPRGYIDTYTTTYAGTRSSPAKAFLPAMKNRKNAFMVVNAQVSKVLLTPDLKATGVEIRLNDQLMTIKASKEVILSAGAINSPQILMNSGIGPKEHLEDLGIPVLKNLDVGKNLRDHTIFPGVLMNIDSNVLPEVAPKDMMDYWYQYLMHRKGPLSMSAVENFISFLNPKNDSIYPTLEMYHFAIHKGDPFAALQTLKHVYNLPPELTEGLNKDIKKADTIFCIPASTYPKSVGKVLLRSNDPFDKPIIDTNYFGDEKDEDVQVLLEGVRFYQSLAKTKAFAAHNPKMIHLDLVNCRKHEPDSDEYWRCAIKNIATTVYHLIGTCKMGPKDDPTAVVDPRLRVYGVKGLRVIDASIMPDMISCNTNAATIMIGEKGSSMIKEDWMKQHTEL